MFNRSRLCPDDRKRRWNRLAALGRSCSPKIFSIWHAVIGINNYTGWELSPLFGLLSKEPVGWPRTVHARLIDRLLSKNARGIVFDFDFSIPKPSDENAALAQAIQRAARVILFESMEFLIF